LYADLLAEFDDDLPLWGTELGKDLKFHFTNTSLLFEEGEFDLKPELSKILSDFFPVIQPFLRPKNTATIFSN
jgi:hypothetical protein